MPRISSSASTGSSSDVYFISASENGSPSPVPSIDSDLPGMASSAITISSSSDELATPIPAKHGRRAHVPAGNITRQVSKGAKSRSISAFGPGKMNRPRKCFIETSSDEDSENSDSERGSPSPTLSANINVPKTRIRVGNLGRGYCFLCEENIFREGPEFRGFLGHIRNSMQHFRALDKRVHGGNVLSGEEVNGEYRVERGVLILYAESSTKTVGTIYKTGSAATRKSIRKAYKARANDRIFSRSGTNSSGSSSQNRSRSSSPSSTPEKKLQTPSRRSDRIAEASAAASLKADLSARYQTRTIARRLSSRMASKHI